MTAKLFIKWKVARIIAFIKIWFEYPNTVKRLRSLGINYSRTRFQHAWWYCHQGTLARIYWENTYMSKNK